MLSELEAQGDFQSQGNKNTATGLINDKIIKSIPEQLITKFNP